MLHILISKFYVAYIIQENSISSYIFSQVENRPKVIFQIINAMLFS